MSRRDELAGAFMLLTRLPVARFARGPAAAADCVWAYPLAGAAAGAVGAAVFAVAGMAVPATVAAILAVGATVLVTGGLHEDGLADTADGFGGGRTRLRKLEIMRDSRIGSFGALALMLSLGLRVSALAQLGHPAAALIAAGASARGAMIAVLWCLPAARADGLAAPLAALRPGTALAGLALAAALAMPALGALPAAFGAAAIVAVIARRQIGGYTGDVLGAAEQAAECAALTALLVR